MSNEDNRDGGVLTLTGSAWSFASMPKPESGTYGLHLTVYGSAEFYKIPYAVMAAAAVEQAFALADRLPADDPLVPKLREMAKRGLDELRAGLCAK